MSSNHNDKPTQSIKPKTVPIRIRPSTAKHIKSTLEKINKKELGRRINADDVVALALKKLTQKDFDLLREASFSNADKLEHLYRQQCRKNPKLSKDGFIGQILSELQIQGQRATGSKQFEDSKDVE